MSTNLRRAVLSIVTTALCLGGHAAVTEREASAERRVRAGGGGGKEARGKRHRVARRGGWHRRPAAIHVGGHVRVGFGGYVRARWAAPPPPIAPGCDCGPAAYHPVVAEPGVVGGRGHAPLPRWGLGLAAGGVEVQGEAAGDDLALLGRWRLTGALLAEGEVGKSSLADNTRVDRRVGASLVYELGARRRWSPYLVAGAGVTQVDIGGGVYESAQSFAEGGAGLRYAVTPRLHLGLDLRAGSRAPLAAEAEPDQASYRSVTPPDDAPEAYTRGRLSAIVYF